MTSRKHSKATGAEIESDALKANLQETATPGITIDSSYKALLDVVENYRGISNTLNDLLYEISHPYRNWAIILPRVRAFCLKNISHYERHKKGPEAFRVMASIFFTALAESSKNKSLQSQSMEAILAYVEKLVFRLDADGLNLYSSELQWCFEEFYKLDEPVLMLMVQGHHPMKRIAGRILALVEEKPAGQSFNCHSLASLMQKLLEYNYRYWLSEQDPLAWFLKECGQMCTGWEAGRLFNAISHQQMEEHRRKLQEISVDEDSLTALRDILQLPGHMDIVRLYKEVPDKLGNEEQAAASPAGEAGDRFAENRKLLFLFLVMETDGLALIHEETLREINRGLVLLIRQQTFEEIESFLLTTFQLLKANVRKYPHTSMQCIQALGTEVFNRENSRLVETFLWETVRFGFQYANVIGVDEDWQPITNPAHLANIRVWVNLIMQQPKWCSTLFSALIINLQLSGTCVKDTDLFQRDITNLLNHPIEPIYNLFKQFAKLMPVFFNEIGAEGQLREVSTKIDEIHKRRDPLIHFLRKQSHVESSNLIVGFIKAIFSFWNSLDREVLAPFLPEEVLAQIMVKGKFTDELHLLMQRLHDQSKIESVEDLLKWEDFQRRSFLSKQTDINPTETQRFDLLVTMYKLLNQKYNLGHQELRMQLHQAIDSGFPEMEQLLADLEICDTHQCLNSLLHHLEDLKAIILSEQIFEAKEDIYYKRHIAVDIPSVYGRYQEKKFDALSLTFRLENLANLYLEKLPDTVNLSFVTRPTFFRIIRCLKLYQRALSIDGITSRRLETYISLLSSSLGIKRFSYTQYMDIFRGLSGGVKDIIYTNYTNIHQNNLSIIIPQIGHDNLLTNYRSLWNENDLGGSVHRLSESFFRTLIATTFGLQHLDNFITRIIQTLEKQKELLDEKSLDLLMTYNPENAISPLYGKTPRTNNLIHLGNKGYNLKMLAADGKPVPPGFIITTELFRCWPVVKRFDMARNELMQQIRGHLNKLETQTGKLYGNPQNPLLLSVRSGAAISMPGMMATIHNIGLNQDIVEEFARSSGKEYLAWDNFRRFIQSWGMTCGMAREPFQELMDSAKAHHKVEVKRKFTPDQMKELALSYLKNVRDAGVHIPDDPWLQLIEAVEMVIDSWNAEKSVSYRELMDTSSNWGTAAIVQAMVYGNLDQTSGSGVLFTAHPYRKVSRVALWGDYAFNVQGEDIVSGLITTYPISVEQAEITERYPGNAIEVKFPAIYKELLTLCRELVYEKKWNPQEIEFTFEGPRAEDLYILQTRDMITIKKKEHFDVFVDSKNLQESRLGKGLGVSGSAMSGCAVFTADNIRQLKKQAPDTKLILIRQDTVPEDIKEISIADGLLTARGGQTSHASVVATQLEKTCVVGCKALKVYESEERCEINGHTISFGDQVSIDGRKGLFLKGSHPIKEEVHILPI